MRLIGLPGWIWCNHYFGLLLVPDVSSIDICPYAQNRSLPSSIFLQKIGAYYRDPGLVKRQRTAHHGVPKPTSKAQGTSQDRKLVRARGPWHPLWDSVFQTCHKAELMKFQKLWFPKEDIHTLVRMRNSHKALPLDEELQRVNDDW